jgi:membrane fusion protein, multidrug efflux system
MKKSKIFPLFGLIMILIISACGKKPDEARSMEQLHSDLGVPVRVMSIEKGTFEQNLRYNAVLSGSKESTASAMLSDVVSNIHFQVGDRVEKDDVVISFPTDNPSAQYTQARSAFESIEAIHNRMQRLYEENAISLQDYENVRTQYLVSKANLEASEQMIKVKAPISGVITNIAVSTAENVFPGMELFTVAATSGYKATLMIPEAEISKFKTGTRVTAKWEGKSIPGRVTTIALAMDPATKAFRVEAEFPGNAGIPYGVTAEISVEIARKANTFTVQRHHLVRENEDYFLWLADGDKAKRVAVEIGLDNQLEYEITSGLSEGDLMIIEGIKSLSEDSKIRIIEGS